MPVCLYNTPSQEFEQKQLKETRPLGQIEQEIHNTVRREHSLDEFAVESEGVSINDIFAAQQLDCGSMPCWYYDKKELRNTPSIRDGLTLETERRYRKEGARFIMSCGTQMGLGHNTMATGVVYFHRFYMFHSFRTFPRYVTACCCLFLAGKVEETPKKCRDVIKTARTLLDDNHFYSFGEDPKEEVMTLERVLLQTIKFDLQVEHPYSFLLKYAKCFKGDQTKLQKMVQMAWNFVNDSLSTTVCLQWEPEIIAVALIYLASKLSKFIVNDWNGREAHHIRWWDMFVEDVTMEILEDICHQVLDLYQKNQKEETDGSNSPPQKPPSRADSPTPLVKQSYESPQPTPQQQQQQQQQQQHMDTTDYHQAAHYEASRNSKHAAQNPAPPPSDVQTIKTLGTTSHSRYPANAGYYQADIYTPPPLPPQGMHMTMHYTATPPPPPPPPPHNIPSTVSNSRSIPLPPLPPMPPPAMGFYGHMPVMPAMPPTNSSASQYSRAPPPPPPPAVPNGSSNHLHDEYYHHSHQSYQPHHSSHRGRHHRRSTHRY